LDVASVAQATPAGILAIAVVALWKKLEAKDAQIADLHAKWREEVSAREQNAKLYLHSLRKQPGSTSEPPTKL
jgi:hypothetical protein